MNKDSSVWLVADIKRIRREYIEKRERETELCFFDVVYESYCVFLLFFFCLIKDVCFIPS
jgi:hypothetical protein